MADDSTAQHPTSAVDDLPADATTHVRPGRRRTTPTAADLVATGAVSAQQAYSATLVLARLHDRGVGRTLTLEEMCEVLGYLGDGRRPASVSGDRVAPRGLRRGPKAN